jgi:hypothetical protein
LMSDLYGNVLTIVSEDASHPVGFVNLPHHVTWNRSMYPLIHDGVVFVPWYSNLSEYVSVNLGRNWGNLDAVIYGPVIRETNPFLGSGGTWLDAVELYSYAQEHRSIYLTHLGSDGKKLVLREVGSILERSTRDVQVPLVTYTGGPNILSATLEEAGQNAWTLTILWESLGPVVAEIFVHIYDGDGNLLAQADGPALSGLIPLWVWRPDDYIRDVRYIHLPSDVLTRATSIAVGIYNEDGRFPALIQGQRAVDDAAIIATVE